MQEHLALQIDDYTAGHEILSFMGPQIFVIVFTKAYNRTVS